MKHRTLLGFFLTWALCLLGGASSAAVQLKAPTEKFFKYKGATGNVSFSVHVDGAKQGDKVSVAATPGADWIQIIKGATQDVILDAKGNGKGKVQYRVAVWNHYPPTGQRTGTIEVDDGAAPATFTVKQSGAACKLAITPTKSSFLSDATLATGGGSLATITVTATEGCQWTATVDAASAWISTPTLGAGTASFTVAANDQSRKPRVGKVTVATTNVPKAIAKTHTVSQKGDTTPPIVAADPQGGTFGASTEVRLSANEAGAKIYYTLNGSKPSASSTLYTGPIQIARTSTLNFIGVDRAGNVSAAAAETYTVAGGGSGTFAQALQSFEAGDLGAAHDILLSLDPLDDKGRTLLAVTTFFTVVDDAKAAGTPFKNLLDELGLQVVGDTLDTLDVIKPDQPLVARSARQAGRTVGRAVHDAPVVPDTHPSAEALLAKVKEAQALLADVGKSVTFTVKGYEVDYSDVLAARAALSTLEFLLEFSLAYDFTYTRYHDPGPEVTAENLQDLRLASDSVTHLAASKKALVAAIDLVVLSVDAVRAETDDQSDDLLTVDGEVAAMWPDLKNGLADAKASLGSSSFKAIRVFGTGDRTLTKTETVGGEVVATYTATVYRAFLVAKLSAFFDAPLDGADVKADFDNNRAKVTVIPQIDLFTGETTYEQSFWFDPDASSVASFLKSVLQDVEFGVSEENGVQRTEFRAFFRTAATGGVLLKDAQGYSLSPPEAAALGLPVQTSPLTFTAAVALPLPTAQGTRTVDGSAADWGTAAAALGEDATIQAARDGSYLYLLVRDSRLSVAGAMGVSLHFRTATPGGDQTWPDWFGSVYLERWDGGGALTGNFWPANGTSTAVTAAAGAGAVEIRIPVSVFGGFPSGATVYLGHYDAWGDTWDYVWSSEDADPLGHGLGAEDFWGYQLSY